MVSVIIANNSNTKVINDSISSNWVDNWITPLIHSTSKINSSTIAVKRDVTPILIVTVAVIECEYYQHLQLFA